MAETYYLNCVNCGKQSKAIIGERDPKCEWCHESLLRKKVIGGAIFTKITIIVDDIKLANWSAWTGGQLIEGESSGLLLDKPEKVE
jgi:DNA-directed RNA polymerase subunit RPC12/RpoP